jgi:hypothetical protein
LQIAAINEITNPIPLNKATAKKPLEKNVVGSSVDMETDAVFDAGWRNVMDAPVAWDFRLLTDSEIHRHRIQRYWSVIAALKLAVAHWKLQDRRPSRCTFSARVQCRCRVEGRVPEIQAYTV